MPQIQDAQVLELNDRLMDVGDLKSIVSHSVDFLDGFDLRLSFFRAVGPTSNGQLGDALISNKAPKKVSSYLKAQDSAAVEAIANVAYTHQRPYRWREASRLSRAARRGKRKLPELEKASNLDGYALPVYSAYGRAACLGVSLTADHDPLTDHELYKLQWAAQLVHFRFAEVAISTIGNVPRLSARETEILGWIAVGKSNSAIADILGITTHTVDSYTRRIFIKLDVNDRTSAVVRAIGYGALREQALPAA